jgi:hypothetical protein
MFKAVITLTTFSRSGWDEYENYEEFEVFGNTLDNLKLAVEKYKKENQYNRTGDFGITLGEAKVTGVKYFEVLQQEVVKEV